MVSLEMWPIMVSSWASGSGSSMAGENKALPLSEDVLGVVRWLGEER